MKLRSGVRNVVSLALLAPALIFGTAASGIAQSAAPMQRPEGPAPGGPAGRTAPAVPQPSDPNKARGGSDVEPESRLRPRDDQGGGCRYRERTLELIV